MNTCLVSIGCALSYASATCKVDVRCGKDKSGLGAKQLKKPL